MSAKKTFLHAGCGRKGPVPAPGVFPPDEWREIRLDADPAVEPDVVATITAMPEIEDEAVDAVFTSHTLEHLYAHEVAAALAEFMRVIRPGGFALIIVPDLQAVAGLVAAGKAHQPAYESAEGPITPLDMIYGHGPSLAAGKLHMAHRTGFTAASLVAALADAGFAQRKVDRRPEHLDIRAVAFKAL
jgi:SAM-dependent methyltransferase